MNIPFKRREFQEECERIARRQQGLEEASDAYIFKNQLEVKDSDLALLKTCLSHDSVSFYFNAAYSFLQGLKSININSFSWGTVQLYYSVFYSCKAILGFNNIGIIRKKGLSKIELKVGEKAKSLKENNDHKQAFLCYKTSFPSAFILSNNINEQDFLGWIQEAREITNYRQQVLQEPKSLIFLTKLIEQYKNSTEFKTILDKFASNWALYCFQEDSAIVAGSYKLLSEAYDLYAAQNEKITVPQKRELSKLCKSLKIDNLKTSVMDV